jgi:hypothetical protein
MQFTVRLKQKGKLDRIVLDAEDAPTAALKVMAEHSEAIIRYVRPCFASRAKRSARSFAVSL